MKEHYEKTMADTERTGISGRNQSRLDSQGRETCEQQDRESAANESGDGSEVCRTPTHLDLFSGIGGFALAAQWAGFRTIGFCEIDRYCQKVLAKNFFMVSNAGHANAQGWNGNEKGIEGATRLKFALSESPRIFGDIFNLDGRQFVGVSLITGGFPCQPFSVAGERRGAADDRAIWPQMFRVISEARPAWVLGENVPGIIPMELDNVLSDLEGIGYATRPFVIPACAVDARHRRDRLWIVGRNMADTDEGRIRRAGTPGNERHAALSSEAVPDSNGQRSQGWNGEELRECAGKRVAGQGDSFDNGCIWLPEPDVGRVAHGIPSRVDRLKGLGNAIVPQVAYEILKVIYNEIVQKV